MKKILLMAAVTFFIVSCNKEESTKSEVKNTETNSSGYKTAYIDTEKLMKDYEESKQFEAKYKSMSEHIQNELENDMKKFQRDVQDLQQNAQSKGMEWAQNRQAELERRQATLQQKEANYMQKFQQEGATERDSMVSKMKSFIKDYGKEKGYDYIYGTGDAATVLFAKDQYDITEEILKIMNDDYSKKIGSSDKKDEKPKQDTK